VPINFFPGDLTPGDGAFIDSSIIRPHSAG